jgi:vacuolar protein sorting-associated protein 13A/C
MLEGIVTQLLNRYLGEFIENLDAEQVRVGMLSGKAVLRGLRLRRDALARLLDLPLDVVVGTVGSITLSVPLRALRSKPCEVVIADVSAVVVKRTDVPVVPRTWLATGGMVLSR